jgi:hypothetical protein
VNLQLSLSAASATGAILFREKLGMDGSADGHTFIVVGPDGRVDFRADYGGAPNYTMYDPISTLLADMKEGLHGKS